MADKPRNPLHSTDCPACGAPLGIGVNYAGQKIEMDLRVKVYAWARLSATNEVVQTEMAAAAHEDVCPYRDV